MNLANQQHIIFEPLIIYLNMAIIIRAVVNERLNNSNLNKDSKVIIQAIIYLFSFKKNCQ